MYLGRYYHTIEEKGRISLPKKFRAKEQLFIITRGLDGGLFIFDQEEWSKQIGELTTRTLTKKSHRDFTRLMTNDAQEVEVDNQGRILIPEYLRDFAQLSKQAVVVGSFNKIEIWNPDKYHTYIETIEKESEQIAEEIEQVA
jgi:MraZ protein